jgi:hypothetical protein
MTTREAFTELRQDIPAVLAKRQKSNKLLFTITYSALGLFLMDQVSAFFSPLIH